MRYLRKIIVPLVIGGLLTGCTATTRKDGTNETKGANGQSAYALAVEKGYTGTESEWLVSLQGQNGIDGKNGIAGIKGMNGKSAYALAVEKGYIGTESEWLATLKGSKGATGLGFEYYDQSKLDTYELGTILLDSQTTQALIIVEDENSSRKKAISVTTLYNENEILKKDMGDMNELIRHLVSEINNLKVNVQEAKQEAIRANQRLDNMATYTIDKE